ncbi:hypothetical protein PSACC_02182 [Paramicrosporidium saccamoebae]|uniref:Chitin-binding type-4 domain-containing protein n=1 Tax=Paramicrosporidium saccamoebae TaxID=1246581 RepID=A0A2H9TJT2_9FUNG|nr:hypothetical protein PSACC_02182 [Paramicrosporidium saccamoebae]
MKLVCGSLLLASLLFGRTSANGYFCNPEPRRIQPDFLNQCPKPVRDMGGDQIMRKSMQQLSVLVGKDSRPPGFCEMPCGGIPHDRETARVIQAGDQMAVGWMIATSSMSQCQVTLMCPGMRGDSALWRGACGMRPGRIDVDIMLPVDTPACEFGECFVQWRMETDSGEIFVGCVDIIIIKPPRRPIPEQPNTCLSTTSEMTTEITTEFTPTDETTPDWTPTDETTTDWTPTDETTTDWTPTDETTTDWTPTDETTPEETTPDISTSVVVVTSTVTNEVPTVTTVTIGTTDSTVSTIVTTVVETVTSPESPITTAPVTSEVTVTEISTVFETPLTVVTSVSTSTELNGLTVWTTVTETLTMPPEKDNTESLSCSPCPECSDATTMTVTEITQYAPSWPTTEETITVTTVITEEITSSVIKKVPITTTGGSIEFETDTSETLTPTTSAHGGHTPAYQASHTMSMDYHRMRY